MEFKVHFTLKYNSAGNMLEIKLLKVHMTDEVILLPG